jgi:hypothetical protein
VSFKFCDSGRHGILIVVWKSWDSEDVFMCLLIVT